MSAIDDTTPGVKEDDDQLFIFQREGDEVYKYMITRRMALLSSWILRQMELDSRQISFQVPASIKPATLALICEFLTHHDGNVPARIPKPLPSKNLLLYISRWDDNFLESAASPHIQTLYDVILAALQLGIDPLLHYGCAKIAALIKGQPVENIQPILQPH
jgi:hypothetical protein